MMAGGVGEKTWPCTLRRVHVPHRWWSRRMKRYYRCPGRQH